MSKLRVLDLFSGYTIDDNGVVKSRFGRKIKAQMSNSGYLRIELSSNGIAKKFLLHRLVAMAFVPNPKNKPHVNHKDGDKLNNFPINLEWVTQSENQKHAYDTGLQVGFRKSVPLTHSHKMALCGSRWRGERRIYCAEGFEFSNPIDAAKHFGVSRQTFYNRSKSNGFPSWNIKIRREEK